MSKAGEVIAGRVLRDPVLFLAFGFGAGLARKAPGTWGTVAAVPLYVLLAMGSERIYLGVLLAVCVAGVWICGRAARLLGVHDHRGIVWDEIAGYLMTMLGTPFSWEAVFVGFVLFRLFDILKPWPIRLIDRNLHGGLGIMLDDILAGVCAAAVLTALRAYSIV
ncbi:MAG: phosphatidylglycerophosphatase A [Pseudomonadota bacterium]